MLLYSRIFWKSLNVYSTIVTATLNSIVLLYASNILISIIKMSKKYLLCSRKTMLFVLYKVTVPGNLDAEQQP